MNEEVGPDDLEPAEEPEGRAHEFPSGAELLGEQHVFAHPTWALPMILVMSVPFLLWGLLGHPVWLLIGSPFILVLAVWIYVRVVQSRRGSDEAIDESGRTDA